MSLPTEHKVWVLANPPAAYVQPDTFALETRALPPVADDQVLVKIKYLSNDPIVRTLISAAIPRGGTIATSGLAEVVASKSAAYAPGDLVSGRFDWGDYAVVPATALTGKAIELPGKPYASLSVLGLGSLTAYFGVFDQLKVAADDVVVVSSAAGSVGSAAIQFAKHVAGAKRVVGIAGGADKCAWVKSLGADDCIDYKSPDFRERLAAAVPDKIDKVFENVGGEVLDTILPLMKPHGQIAVCGLLSSYNGQQQVFNNLLQVISLRIDLRGFTVMDFVPRWAETAQQVAQFVKDGKVSATDTETVVTATVDEIPQTWALLFTGKSRGKLLTQLE
jgi:NADPH-dependent curcumin reductase CurA